ncbi:MAG: NAD(P)-dependent oxidoreductase [Leptolyngbyaceae cyanobacterium]
MQTIAFLGLGAMGSRIADHLIKAGFPLVVYNRTAAAAQALVDQGAVYVNEPKAAAAQADIVMSMVTDDEASRAVWLDEPAGALYGLRPGTIAIAVSTLTVAWTEALAQQIEARDAAFWAAPVVGSRPQAEAGSLHYLVGGNLETLSQVSAILATSGQIHRVGSVGQAMAMKLAVNAYFGIQVAALAELITLLQHYGFSLPQTGSGLQALPIMGPAAMGASALMLADNHAPLFPIDLANKDLGYALAMAQAVHTNLPTVAATHQLFAQAIAAGHGPANITSVIKMFA